MAYFDVVLERANSFVALSIEVFIVFEAHLDSCSDEGVGDWVGSPYIRNSEWSFGVVERRPFKGLSQVPFGLEEERQHILRVSQRL